MNYNECPAYQLLESFCQSYSTRNITNLTNLFTKNPIFQFECNSSTKSMDCHTLSDIRKEFLESWKKSEKSQLSLASILENSVPKGSRTIAYFRYIKKDTNGLFHLAHLKGTLICKNEDSLWHIAELRFVPAIYGKDVYHFFKNIFNTNIKTSHKKIRESR